jgi:hypothetical protein
VEKTYVIKREKNDGKYGWKAYKTVIFFMLKTPEKRAKIREKWYTYK